LGLLLANAKKLGFLMFFSFRTLAVIIPTVAIITVPMFRAITKKMSEFK